MVRCSMPKIYDKTYDKTYDDLLYSDLRPPNQEPVVVVTVDEHVELLANQALCKSLANQLLY